MASFLVVLTLILQQLTNAANIIIPPIDGKNGDPIGLIYIVGASLAPSQYVALCKTLQQEFPQPLYVGIVDFHQPNANNPELKILLPSLLKEMESKGIPPNSSYYMVGHSLGGAVVQKFGGEHYADYRKIYPDWVLKGQILDAAFITRNWRNRDTHLLSNYSIPTLTLMGELDSRIARICEQFYIQLIKPKSNDHHPFVDDKTLLNFPIILIDGMNHMEWATGQIPKEVMEQDLMATISTEDAHKIVSQYMACWMSLQLKSKHVPKGCDFNMIYRGVSNSMELVSPFIDSYKMEGSVWFEEPCNCKEQICHSESSPNRHCEGGAKWLSNSAKDDTLTMDFVPQEMMCGFNKSQKVSILNTDSFHSFSTSFFHPHYAHIWNNCTSTMGDGKECALNTSTATQNVYYVDPIDFFADYVDTGGHSTSAIEVRHKMKSRESCYEQIGAGSVEEDFEVCGKINERIIEWVLKNKVPKQTLDRYMKYGESLVVGPDVKETTGTEWTFNPLTMERKCNNETHRYYTEITSRYLFSKSHGDGCKFGNACGAHYCKLISPAHVMEWVYYNGLRFNLSIANTNRTVNVTC